MSIPSSATKKRAAAKQPATNASTSALLPQNLLPEQRLRAAQVLQLIGACRSKLYLDIRKGNFPAPERRGPRCSRWRAGDVLAWLEKTRRAQDGRAQ